MGEMVDQKKREAALCDNVKELEQQHSDLTVIYHAVSHSIHFKCNFAVECY